MPIMPLYRSESPDRFVDLGKQFSVIMGLTSEGDAEEQRQPVVPSRRPFKRPDPVLTPRHLPRDLARENLEVPH